MYRHSNVQSSDFDDENDMGLLTYEEDGLVFTFTNADPSISSASNVIITSSEDNDLEHLISFQQTLKSSMISQLIFANLNRRAGVVMKTIETYLHVDLEQGNHSIALVGSTLAMDEFASIRSTGEMQPESYQEFSYERIGTINGIPVMIKQTLRRCIGRTLGVITFQVSLLSPNHTMYDITFSDMIQHVINRGLEEYSQRVYGGFMPYVSSFETLNTSINSIHIDSTIFSCDVMVQCKLVHIGGVAHSMVIDSGHAMIGTVHRPDLPSIPDKQNSLQMLTSSEICQTIISYQPSAVSTVHKNGAAMTRTCCIKDHYTIHQACMVLPAAIATEGDERVHTCKFVGSNHANLWLPLSLTIVELRQYEFHRVYGFITVTRDYGVLNLSDEGIHRSLNMLRRYLLLNDNDTEDVNNIFQLLNDNDDIHITPVYATTDTHRFVITKIVDPDETPEILRNSQGPKRSYSTNSPYEYEFDIEKYYITDDDEDEEDEEESTESDTIKVEPEICIATEEPLEVPLEESEI